MTWPIYAHSVQNQPDIFDRIFQALSRLAKYLKEKCSSEHNQQLSFKYFVNPFLIQNLSS